MKPINEDHANALVEAEQVSAKACKLLSTEVESLHKSVEKSNNEKEELRSKLESAIAEQDVAVTKLKVEATANLDKQVKKISKEHATATS